MRYGLLILSLSLPIRSLRTSTGEYSLFGLRPPKTAPWSTNVSILSSKFFVPALWALRLRTQCTPFSNTNRGMWAVRSPHDSSVSTPMLGLALFSSGTMAPHIGDAETSQFFVHRCYSYALAVKLHPTTSACLFLWHAFRHRTSIRTCRCGSPRHPRTKRDFPPRIFRFWGTVCSRGRKCRFVAKVEGAYRVYRRVLSVDAGFCFPIHATCHDVHHREVW